MKVRIKDNSLRLRIARSEVDTLLSRGRIEETLWLAPGETARQTWALTHSEAVHNTTVSYNPPEIVLAFPSAEIQRWAASDEVGIYATIDLDPRGSLDLLIEKDFACLHGDEAQNQDAFPNPRAGA